MKSKQELAELIGQIACEQSPVGMDAVYVHALILDHLQALHERLERLEQKVDQLARAASPSGTDGH